MIRVIITWFLVMTVFSLTGQQQINGQVIDSETEEAIVYATIAYSETKGVYSNENGQFILRTTPKGNKLIVSCVGYKTQIIQINNRSNLQIRLVPDNLKIPEIKITAYSQKKIAKLFLKAIHKTAKSTLDTVSTKLFYRLYSHNSKGKINEFFEAYYGAKLIDGSYWDLFLKNGWFGIVESYNNISLDLTKLMSLDRFFKTDKELNVRHRSYHSMEEMKRRIGDTKYEIIHRDLLPRSPLKYWKLKEIIENYTVNIVDNTQNIGEYLLINFQAKNPNTHFSGLAKINKKTQLLHSIHFEIDNFREHPFKLAINKTDATISNVKISINILFKKIEKSVIAGLIDADISYDIERISDTTRMFTTAQWYTYEHGRTFAKPLFKNGVNFQEYLDYDQVNVLPFSLDFWKIQPRFIRDNQEKTILHKLQSADGYQSNREETVFHDAIHKRYEKLKTMDTLNLTMLSNYPHWRMTKEKTQKQIFEKRFEKQSFDIFLSINGFCIEDNATITIDPIMDYKYSYFLIEEEMDLKRFQKARKKTVEWARKKEETLNDKTIKCSKLSESMRENKEPLEKDMERYFHKLMRK